MRTQRRKQHSAELKAKIALEAIKGQRTINELASAHGIHPTQITQWKRQLLEESPRLFSNRRERAEKGTICLQDGQEKNDKEATRGDTQSATRSFLGDMRVYIIERGP